MTTEGKQSEAERLKLKALTRWEGEGGGLGATPSALSNNARNTDTLDETELRILARLGAAVLGQWNTLPTELQLALYTRASTPYLSSERVHLKSEIARFLESYKDR